jgi:hypothetical protein
MVSIHRIVIEKLSNELRNEGHKVRSSISNKPVPRFRGKNGKYYLPDIEDETEKMFIEVNWKGEKKTVQFKNLPEGYKGANAFIDDDECSSTFIVKKGSLSVKRIEWK